jgi:hypothetical protein
MSYEFQGRTWARAEADSGRSRRRRASPEGELAGGEPRVPMHAFAASTGLLFLLVGVAGFIPGITRHYGDMTFAGPDSGAKLLGLFAVSVLHNIVHLLFGVGLIAAARYSWSRLYLIGGGILFLLFTAYGAVVDRRSDANFLPFNRADNMLHVVLSLAMIALGILGARLRKPWEVPPAPPE